MMLHELTPEEKQQYQDVASELRCLVCQNQSIADSQAGLASDLKQIIVDQIREGRSKEEIKVYMEDRYGEFILYKPEMSASNAVLWAGPFLVLILAVVLARRVIKSHRLSATTRQQGKSARDNDNWAEALYKKESDR
jgi:cytochrome c-type biogenesis protein CcmH